MKNFNPITKDQFDAIKSLLEPVLSAQYTLLSSGTVKIKLNKDLFYHLGVNEERGYFIRRSQRHPRFRTARPSVTTLNYNRKTRQYNFSSLLGALDYFLHYLIRNKYIRTSK